MNRSKVGETARPALVGKPRPSPVQAELNGVSGAYTGEVKHLGLHNHSAMLDRSSVRLMIVHQQEIA
jgi:hypothetical protein